MSGRLETIWVKRAKRGPMDERASVEMRAGSGIVGNANQGGRRQVTLLEREVWSDLLARVDREVAPEARRANLFVAGFPLKDSRGRTLQVGDVRLVVRGETKPCERMEEACPGLQDAMYPEWRGGAYAEVLDDGVISVGDAIVWVDENAEG